MRVYIISESSVLSEKLNQEDIIIFLSERKESVCHVNHKKVIYFFEDIDVNFHTKLLECLDEFIQLISNQSFSLHILCNKGIVSSYFIAITYIKNFPVFWDKMKIPFCHIRWDREEIQLYQKFLQLKIKNRHITKADFEALPFYIKSLFYTKDDDFQISKTGEWALGI